MILSGKNYSHWDQRKKTKSSKKLSYPYAWQSRGASRLQSLVMLAGCQLVSVFFKSKPTPGAGRL